MIMVGYKVDFSFKAFKLYTEFYKKYNQKCLYNLCYFAKITLTFLRKCGIIILCINANPKTSAHKNSEVIIHVQTLLQYGNFIYVPLWNYRCHRCK